MLNEKLSKKFRMHWTTRVSGDKYGWQRLIEPVSEPTISPQTVCLSAMQAALGYRLNISLHLQNQLRQNPEI